MKWWRLVLSLLLAFCLIGLVGCSGDDDDTADETENVDTNETEEVEEEMPTAPEVISEAKKPEGEEEEKAPEESK